VRRICERHGLRFRADFTNGTNSFSVYFNKDASPYFLPMAFTIQGRVTDLAGTTRDLLRETIRLDGVELTLVDTAGLREAGDAIEAEGIRRARSEVARADLALAVVDARDPEAGRAAVADGIAGCVVAQQGRPVAGRDRGDDICRCRRRPAWLEVACAAAGASARATREGASAAAPGMYRRWRWRRQLAEARRSCGERWNCRRCTRTGAFALGEIGGRLSADGLLGHIFSSFCIGK
jgi:tRNA modification GTPase